MKEPTEDERLDLNNYAKELATVLERMGAKEMSLRVYDNYCDNEWIVTARKVQAPASLELK